MSDLWKPKVVVLRGKDGESIYHQADPEKTDKQAGQEDQQFRFDFNFHGNCPTAQVSGQNTESNWQKTIRIGKVIGETILVLAAAWGAWCIYWQLDANTRQAKAAEGQLIEMQKEQRVDIRPWVFTSRQVQITNSVGPDIWRVFYHNVGKTPALNIQSVNGNMTSLSGLLPGGISIQTNDQVSYLLAPTGGEDYNVDIPILLPPGRSFFPDGGSLFLSCQVAYDDVFGIHHWVRNTWELHQISSNQIGFKFPQKGNDCDTNY